MHIALQNEKSSKAEAQDSHYHLYWIIQLNIY